MERINVHKIHPVSRHSEVKVSEYSGETKSVPVSNRYITSIVGSEWIVRIRDPWSMDPIMASI